MKYNSLSRKGLLDIETEILKLYDVNLPIKQICDKLNVGKSTVHNYLKKNGKRRQILHTFDDGSFSIFNPESCYWAGFIAADGCIDKKLYYLRVDLNISDKKHLEKLLGFVKDKNPIITSGFKTSIFDKKSYNINHCYADINSVKIVKDLRDNFNVAPAKSFTLLPPTKMPKELIKHYIRGYFDGDGSIHWNKSHKSGVFHICSGSKELLNWIADNIKEHVDYEFSDKAFVLRNSGSISYIQQLYNSAEAIFNWLYTDSTPETRLDRKYERYLKYYK